ncbi:MAG: hypothetical protein HOP28_17995 [Gemmatimonadales bacterium]|nr:hypothetical protein [Gemmatimonadales bacterium]
MATARAMEELARGLALVLGEESARQMLYRSIHGSELLENKLALKAYFTGSKGKSILASAQQGAAASDPMLRVDLSSALAALVAALPDLDVYIAHPVHRARWRPDQPLAVVALVDEYSPLAAYLADGSRMPIDRLSTVPTETAVLFLGPKESRIVPRVGLLLDEEGELECLRMGSGSQSNSCGGGSSAPPVPYLRADKIETFNICDNGNCWEGNEFEFRARTPGGPLFSPVLRCEGVGSSELYDVRTRCGSFYDKVHSATPLTVAYIDVHIYETDSWPSADDDYKNFLTPTSGACADAPHVTSTHTEFTLYEVPWGIDYSGLCHGPFDPAPQWVGVSFHW